MGFVVLIFVVDVLGGGGKIVLQLNYLFFQSLEKVVIRNFEGVIMFYFELENYILNQVDDYFEFVFLGMMVKCELVGLSVIFVDKEVFFILENVLRINRRKVFIFNFEYEMLKDCREKRDELKEKKFIVQ